MTLLCKPKILMFPNTDTELIRGRHNKKMNGINPLLRHLNRRASIYDKTDEILMCV